jgi:hypothetical protein
VVAAAVLLASCALSIDPVSKGGSNIEWTMSPSAEHISQLLGWRDLQVLTLNPKPKPISPHPEGLNFFHPVSPCPDTSGASTVAKP